VDVAGQIELACVGFAVLLASTVNTFLFGSSVQPSSSLMSALPVPVGVHVSADGVEDRSVRGATIREHELAIGENDACASPIVVHPAGGATAVHARWWSGR
jgi:hypothetical protein